MRLAWQTALAASAVVAAALAAAPAVATAAGTAADAPVSGGIGLQLLDAPSGARDDPRARLYVVDHLAPGAVIRRRIKVTNGSAATVAIRIYAAAASIRQGAFLGAAGRTVNELSSWTAIRPRTARLAAQASATAGVTIRVPRDAAPGERYGVAWVETRATPRAGGITQVSRVGIRLYVSIGPGGTPAADFRIGALSAERLEDGRPRVVAVVHNTGGRALDVHGALRLLDGPGGLRAGPFAADLGTVVGIGDRVPVSIVLHEELPAGPWNARLALRSGLIERRAQRSITFPTTDASSRLLPAIAAIVALLLVLGAAAAGIGRGRRRRLAAAGHSERAQPHAPR